MKWYKQSSTEYLNADLRNACSITDDNTKVLWKDVAFMCTNGLLSVLKQKISANLDLKKAVIEYGTYLTTVRMDKSMFHEITKCKDWELIMRCLGYLNNSGSRISFYEENKGNIIAIDIPNILQELDNYSTTEYKKKIKSGEINPNPHLAHSTDNVVVDKSTGELITSNDIESDPHTDSNMNKGDIDLTKQTSTHTSDERVLIENRKQILKSIGKSDKEIEELINKEFYDDVPF